MLQSASFSDPNTGDTHAASRWQITTTSGDYSSVIFDSLADTSSLSSINLSAGILSSTTTYYWRVRYQDNLGAWSTWSEETSFTTLDHPPSQPTNVSPADGAINVVLMPTLECSVFFDPDTGDTHAASQWQITTTPGNYSSPVFDSDADSYHLTAISIPSGILGYNTTYQWRLRHQDNHGAWSAWSEETSFITLNLAPSQPANVSPTDGVVGISITPTLESSAFSDPNSDDTHASSRWQIATTSGDYSHPVFDSSTDSYHLTAISIPSGTLDYSTTYYWRVRYQDNHGDWSDWSSQTSFTTLNRPPDQPSSLSPTNGAMSVSLTPTLKCSPFSDPDPGDTHMASQWQIATTPGNYSSPVFDSGTDSHNLTQVTLMPGVLSGNTTYYWRMRHQDSYGNWSDWSDETCFTTLNHAPAQPSNLSPADEAMDVGSTPILQSSAFSDPDTADTHAASQWQITTTSGDYSSPIFDSEADSYHLTAISIPSGILDGHTTYYWRVRYQDNHEDWSDWSDETSFTTSNRPPDQPINISPADGASGVNLASTLQASAFSDPDDGDIYTTSQWQVTTSPGDYSHPVFDSGEDNPDSSYMAMASGTLEGSTTYYWRVRYRDDHGDWSDWSAETSFTTLDRPPDRPTNLSPADGVTDAPPDPTLRASLFSDPDTGDTHAASQWQLTSISGDYSNPVFDSGADSYRLTAISIPPQRLDYDTTYYWRLRYQDNHGTWSDWSAETSFTTFGEDTWSHIFADPWTNARLYVNVSDKTFRFTAQDGFDTGVVYDEMMVVVRVGPPALGITTILISYSSGGVVCSAIAIDADIDLCLLTVLDFKAGAFYVLFDPPGVEG